ncbi:MAG: hypothetical protein IPM98_13580 [Lewinellaceae bacterium]|nr:hypothetical protein [Lewinellaceae bacterium]
MWTKSQGSQPNAILLTSVPTPNSASFAEVANDWIIFPTDNRARLWRSDGTPAGTSEFFTLPNNERVESSVVIADTMFFAENTPPPLFVGYRRHFRRHQDD